MKNEPWTTPAPTQSSSTSRSYGWPDVMLKALACAYTGRSRWTLQRAVASGELVAAGRRGRSITFRKEDLDRWLLGNVDGASAPHSQRAARQPSSSGTAAALERLRGLRGGLP